MRPVRWANIPIHWTEPVPFRPPHEPSSAAPEPLSEIKGCEPTRRRICGVVEVRGCSANAGMIGGS